MNRILLPLPLLFLALFASSCHWSEQRCNQQRAKESLIQQGMRVAEVERILRKAAPLQTGLDGKCAAKGSVREVRCVLCDSRWGSPAWWPKGAYSVQYLVICLDDKDQVTNTRHDFIFVN